MIVDSGSAAIVRPGHSLVQPADRPHGHNHPRVLSHRGQVRSSPRRRQSPPTRSGGAELSTGAMSGNDGALLVHLGLSALVLSVQAAAASPVGLTA